MAWAIHNFEPIYVDDEYDEYRRLEYEAGLAIEDVVRNSRADYLGMHCDFENGIVEVLTIDRERVEIPMSEFADIIEAYGL